MLRKRTLHIGGKEIEQVFYQRIMTLTEVSGKANEEE